MKVEHVKEGMICIWLQNHISKGIILAEMNISINSDSTIQILIYFKNGTKARPAEKKGGEGGTTPKCVANIIHKC